MPEQLLRLVNAGYVDDSFQVLKDINWEIRSSSLYQIIGANASGKTNLREPDLLMVITGGELAYTRPDGVKIIPIGCLGD